MDLYKAIRELVDERKRIDRIIASLEAMHEKSKNAPPGKSTAKVRPAKRRGRKSMGAEERREVSQRMARYWAARRSPKVQSGGDSTAEGKPEPGPTS